MIPAEVVRRVVDALDELKIPYMLTGSLASSAYGLARATVDADFVVLLQGPAIQALAARLGPDFTFDPQISFETITATTRFIAQTAQDAFKVEFFLLGDDEFARQRWQRRYQTPLYDRSIWVPTAEDVVIQKLRWSRQGARPKDLEDALNVMKAEGDDLDWEYIRDWCAEQGTLELLEKLRTSIPPI